LTHLTHSLHTKAFTANSATSNHPSYSYYLPPNSSTLMPSPTSCFGLDLCGLALCCREVDLNCARIARV
jgi:hypothetical protein